MTTKISTGLRGRILDSGSLKSRLDGGFLDIYSGTVPATADAALGSAVKLLRVSNNSTPTGLTFEDAAVSSPPLVLLYKESTEVWAGPVTTGGTPSFYRFVKAGDDGTESTTQERIQGSVGTTDTDIELSTSALVAGATTTLTVFVAAFETL